MQVQFTLTLPEHADVLDSVLTIFRSQGVLPAMKREPAPAEAPAPSGKRRGRPPGKKAEVVDSPAAPATTPPAAAPAAAPAPVITRPTAAPAEAAVVTREMVATAIRTNLDLVGTAATREVLVKYAPDTRLKSVPDAKLPQLHAALLAAREILGGAV